MKTTNDIETGITHHKKGELTLAISYYENVLNLNPNHPDSHNLSADAYHRLGNNIKALYHANQAIYLSRNAQFYNTRGMIFIGMEKIDEAISDLRVAAKLDPNNVDVQNNLSIAYRKINQLQKAQDHIQLALSLNPNLVEAWITFSAIKQDEGKFSEALDLIKSALALDNNNLMALANMTKLCYLMNNFEEAIYFGKKALTFGYFNLDIYLPLLHSLIQLNHLPEAVNLILTRFSETEASAYVGLNDLLNDNIFFKTIHDCAQYLTNVVGDPEAAIKIYKKCIIFAPDVAHALWVNIGSIYFHMNLMPNAILSNEEALKCNPGQIWALNNLGVCSIRNEESKKAISYLESALFIDPNFAPSLGWLLKEKGHICDWNRYDEIRSNVSSLKLSNNTSPIAPFTALAVYDDPNELLYWARLSSQELFAPIVNSNVSIERANSPASGNKKLRIGYYSYDFRNHPVAHLTARLFELHDQSKYEIYAYSYGPDDGSKVRERIKVNAKEFIDVKDLSVIDTANRIAADEIDILIDLTGNTLHTRSEVFALRPAKIQAHWLGFIGTMGSNSYDYIFADDVVAPSIDQKYFAEKILHLPSGFHITDDTRIINSESQTRFDNGLPETGVIYGCFCQTFKIQPEIFSNWMEILHGVPGSILWLASGPQGAIENLKLSARGHNIDPDRIIVAQRCSMDEYLSRFSLIDLYLDTFPYSSGTVASDALYSGCPLLTLSGKTMVSRMAGSILKHAGLPELISYSPSEYIEKAIQYGTNALLRERLHNSLREKRANKSLFNTTTQVKELEKIFDKLCKDDV